MRKLIWQMRWVLVLVFMIAIIGCGSDEKGDEAAEIDYERQLKEAQELAEKIRKGDIFNEEALIREKLLHPENVCSLSSDFRSFDFGPNPDFKGNGEAVLYSDQSGVVYYYYFVNDHRYKLFNFGRSPSFGQLPDSSDQFFIMEHFKLRQNSWEGDSHGILVNTEATWNSDPKELTTIKGEGPFMVNGDKHVIYHIGEDYHLLDERMNVKNITKDEYISLRDSRFTFENDWHVKTSYKGIQGIWITDSEEKNWCMLRDLPNIEEFRIVPQSYNIYCWGKEHSGLLMLQSVELSKFTIELKEGQSAKVGDMFEIYEKLVSPISQEIIGFNEDKHKGTVRIIQVVGNKYVCEFQMKIYLEGIFKDDAAVFQDDETIIGRIL